MRFAKVKLTNWKNFRDVEAVLPDRAFLIGPNASGKSNFLDVFRFLRDLSLPGGIQQAVQDRGGVQKIRCLQARNPADVEIEVSLNGDENEVPDEWVYRVRFTQQGAFPRQGSVLIKTEHVSHNGVILVERPDEEDKKDERRLEQTALEQISRNFRFRPIADHFQQISYLHLVPQIIRGYKSVGFDSSFPDIYGGRFLEIVGSIEKRKRDKYLKRIERILRLTVPQLKELNLTRDNKGVPHLEAKYEHWRPNAGKQDETQFSDGTLRLIGLLWMLQDGIGLLLLEEPELSLHQAVVRQLAHLIYEAQNKPKLRRQVLISTHSVDLLSDQGIDSSEILLLKPTENGTEIDVGSEISQIRALMENGLTAADAALPLSYSSSPKQLSFLE